MNDFQEVIDFCPVQTESCLLPPCRGSVQCGCVFPYGTRCIIDGWLIGNSITQRLLGWQTLGHRYPVKTIELVHRREGKVSFRDASSLSSDLLGMPNGHSLVHALTDDLPNCSCSWLESAAQSSREKLIEAKPMSGQCRMVVYFVTVVCDGFNVCACACMHMCLCIP